MTHTTLIYNAYEKASERGQAKPGGTPGRHGPGHRSPITRQPPPAAVRAVLLHRVVAYRVRFPKQF